jgi:hypothetical protein
MFDGCFCEEELISLMEQERDEGTYLYDDMVRAAETNYHDIYEGSDHPTEEEMDVCPNYIQ